MSGQHHALRLGVLHNQSCHTSIVLNVFFLCLSPTVVTNPKSKALHHKCTGDGVRFLNGGPSGPSQTVRTRTSETCIGE
jgi:hypothetical protein